LKNHCTIENGEEDEEFDKAALTQAIARVGMGDALKPEPAKDHYGQI